MAQSENSRVFEDFQPGFARPGKDSDLFNNSRMFRISRSGYLVSHSHIVLTRHPRFLSLSVFSWSLSTLPDNFFSQYLVFDLGLWALTQFGCWCQKHPLTNSASLNRGKTISGIPGRSRRCNLNRHPSECSILRTITSGDVPFDLIRDMQKDLCRTFRLSIILEPCTYFVLYSFKTPQTVLPIPFEYSGLYSRDGA